LAPKPIYAFNTKCLCISVYSGAADPPASTGKATVGPASNKFKAEARLCSGTPGVPLVPIDVGVMHTN